jgi:DNA polymerase
VQWIRAWAEGRPKPDVFEDRPVNVAIPPDYESVPPPTEAERELPTRVALAAGAGDVDLGAARELAGRCRACHLWARATQTVFGRGSVPARWMLVGEQPGDVEDQEGVPFVGPAGRVLSDALEAAGIDSEKTFITNVVKHFKWRPSPGGKRRLHDTPNRIEVGSCLPWVEAELRLVQPDALVLLGSTAAQGLLGPKVRVMRDRGRPYPSELAPLVVVTIHPSAVLRTQTREERQQAFDGLVRDLKVAASLAI